MIWEIALLGVLIAFVNIYYLIKKDCMLYCKEEIEKSSKLIKEIFRETLESKITKKDDIEYIKISNIAYIEAVCYYRLIKENGLERNIIQFSESISDYYEGNLNQEDFTGSYKLILEKVYNMKANPKKYAMFIFTQEWAFICNIFKKIKCQLTKCFDLK